MTPPPSTPKKTRRFTPKIIGHTSPTPRACGTGARNSLRTLAPSAARPSVRPPTGAPGMRGFPRARIHAGDRDSHGRGSCRSTAVSVTLALRELAEAAATAIVAPATTAGRRRARKPGPARTAVVGRPTTPDEQPLAHAPAASRPDDPPLRATVARSEKPPPAAPASQAQVAHQSRGRRRIEPGAAPGTARTGEPSARPRPSRVLAELHAALADEAAAAE